jgi:membrane protein YdbS with pleckstrin-like domain
MSKAVETAKLDEARPQVGSPPTQTAATGQASKKVSTSARAMWFLVAAVCLSIVAVTVGQLVPGSAWEWVNTGAVACMVLAVVGFFAVPRAR